MKLIAGIKRIQLLLDEAKRNITASFYGAPVTFVFQFQKPPYGGGNQFMLALRDELERQGIRVSANRISSKTKTILFNSYNFSESVFGQIKNRQAIRIAHRVDGPIGVYRGEGSEIDKKILAYNQRFADLTIFQSRYSLNRHLQLGLVFKNPVVIPNAVDSTVFHSNQRIAFEPNKRKIRIVASAWSDNPRKGLPAYQWLDSHLDHSRFEFTFVGRINGALPNSRVVSAVPSKELAEILRNQDIYLTASQDDPCSNALVEAMTCGLPAVFLKSGGHPELVGQGGIGFDQFEEIPKALDLVASNYYNFQMNLSPPRIAETCKLYREALNLI